MSSLLSTRCSQNPGGDGVDLLLELKTVRERKQVPAIPNTGVDVAARSRNCIGNGAAADRDATRVSALDKRELRGELVFGGGVVIVGSPREAGAERIEQRRTEDVNMFEARNLRSNLQVGREQRISSGMIVPSTIGSVRQRNLVAVAEKNVAARRPVIFDNAVLRSVGSEPRAVGSPFTSRCGPFVSGHRAICTSACGDRDSPRERRRPLRSVRDPGARTRQAQR